MCKYFFLKDPVFKTGITFLIGSKKEMYDTLCDRLNLNNKEETKKMVMDSDYDGKTCFFDTKDGVEFVIVLFDIKKFRYDVVAHELFHAIHDRLKNHGMVYTTDSEEAFAYLLGWYTKEFFKKIGYKNGRIQIV